MKILHISGANGWGGNEQQIIYILPKLNELGVENTVVGIKGSILEKECTKNNLSFTPFLKRKLNKFSNYKFLAEKVKEEKPDIIQLHTSDSLLFFLIANFFFNINGKLVFSKKGIGSSGSILSKMKYNSKRIDVMLFVSNYVKKSFDTVLTNKNKKKGIVINDCVSKDILHKESNLNIRKLYNIPSHYKIVGNIANHTGAKDLFTLVDVAYHIKYTFKRDDIVFFQIGEFSKRTDKIKQYAISKEVYQQIVFMDKIKNAAVLNKQFDVFLLTSQREGGPTSLLEAMLMETPSVATNVGVVEDCIKYGENGFYAAIKDSKKLAEQIIKIIDDPQLSSKISTHSKQTILQHFTAENIARNTKESFENLLRS